MRWAARCSGGLKSLWRSERGAISKSGGNASLAGRESDDGSRIEAHDESHG